MPKNTIKFTQQAAAQFSCSWRSAGTIFSIDFAKQAVSQFRQQLVAQLTYNAISTSTAVIPALSIVIPGYVHVIPAQAGIHTSQQSVKSLSTFTGAMDSRLRGNDGEVQLPSIEEIEPGLGVEL